MNISKIFKRYRQLILYGLIGGVGATLDLIFYILFYKYLHIPPFIASFLSVSIGIINNFILNSRHNFKVKDRLLYRFVNFYSIGIGGAILSSLLILVLFNGLGIEPTLAKIMTIIPVVLLQFFLNKKYSFRKLNNKKSNKTLMARIGKHSIFAFICGVFLVSGLLFMHFLPKTAPNGGPDEITHYTYNVKFLLDHGRLPVSGKDDISAYQTCRADNNLYGQVPCAYSYQVYPAANYVFSASSAWIFHTTIGISYLSGARLGALFCGLIFIIFIYLASIRLTRNTKISAAVAGAVALIPQVIFVSSYVNQDAFSLAISGILMYSLVRFIQDRDLTSLLLAGISLGGLLPLTKYNYFILAPLFILVVFVGWLRKRLRFIDVAKLAGVAIISFIVIAGFWYVRNYLLYHDILGQSFVLHEMAKYHSLGVAHSILSLDTFKLYRDLGYFQILFNSFFLNFGYMTIGADIWFYQNIVMLLIAVIFVTSIITLRLKNMSDRLSSFFVIFGVFFLLTAAVLLVYYNSAVYDFQPQGRYLFVLLAPIAAAVGYLYRINTNYKYVIAGLLFVSTYAYITGIGLIIRSYL